MLFLNCDFWNDADTLDCIIPGNNSIASVSLQNAVVDEIYVSKDTAYDMATIPQNWDYKTILHAVFNDSINAGNVDFLLDEISLLRLKRREKGTYEWITLAEFAINTIEDFNVNYIDKYTNTNVSYEYALIAVSDSNVEGETNVIEVESLFDGIMIAEKDVSYRAFIYDYMPTERNQLTSVVSTLNSRYPFVVRNSISNYTSGQIRAAFLPTDSCMIAHDYVQDALYREVFTDFLTNGKPKLLKLDDGRCWIVNVVDNVLHSENNGILFTDFNFVETANSRDGQNLYDAGLIDIDNLYNISINSANINIAE